MAIMLYLSKFCIRVLTLQNDLTYILAEISNQLIITIPIPTIRATSLKMIMYKIESRFDKIDRDCYIRCDCFQFTYKCQIRIINLTRL